MPRFQLIALDHTQFAPLFSQTDADLEAKGIVRKQATAKPGFPCRISLEDAAIDDELLLLPYWHHKVASPYKSLGPIYVRQGVTQARLPTDTIPDYVARRLMSIRAYDHEHMMVAADVCAGTEVSEKITSMFEERNVAYIHLHNARQGCFSCLVNRVGDF